MQAEQFLEMIKQGLQCGRFTLAVERDTSGADLPEGCIGWTAAQGEALLHPERTIEAAGRLAEESGITFETKARTLWKRLSEAGLIMGREKDRHTRKIMVAGSYQKVVHVRLSVPELTPTPASEVVTRTMTGTADLERRKALKLALAWMRPRIHELKRAGWTAQDLFRGPESLLRSPFWARATEAKIYPGGAVGFEVPGPFYSRIVNVRPPFRG